MAHLLGAQNVHLEYPTKSVFESISLGVNEGDRIGIVGRNGDGKSTLIALLSGRMQPDSGRITMRNGTRVGVLDQVDRFAEGESVRHAIVGDRPEYEWAGDPRVRDVIAGLLDGISFDAVISSLSGGQRRRVSLAVLLLEEWEVLFLDEPTNHLDIEGITWLAEHLKHRWAANAGGLLVVTHDRWFLDEVCTTTWEVHDGIVEPFVGGYAAYVLQRVQRDTMAAAAETRRKNLMRKELAWLRRGAPARTSKPKFHIEAANQLIEDVPPIRDSIALSQMAVARLGKDVVDLLGVSVSYGDHEVLHDIEWRIAPGERTGILGVNGAGKSTLLGLITGAVLPTSGRVKKGVTVKVATLSQQLGELDEAANDRVSDLIGRKKASYVADGKELTPAQLVERLGFSTAQLMTPINDLSGGQRRRLQLLLILLDEPNVLVLDEPTNDMDTDMLAAMEDLLDSWPGTLIVVSHDRYLLERTTDQQYAIIDGTLVHMPGGVDQYLAVRAEEEKAASREAAGTVGGSATGGGPRSGAASNGSITDGGQVLSGAERRALEKELAAAERKVDRLGAELETLSTRMAEFDPSDYEGLIELGAKQRELEADRSAAEERWFELSSSVGDA